MLRAIIECAVRAESACYESDENAEALLGRIEQSFFEHGPAARIPTLAEPIP